MKPNKPLQDFMIAQQEVVAKIRGAKYISLWQFVKEVGTTETYALKLCRTGKLPGAHVVQFKDGPRWIIPSEHGYVRREKTPVVTYSRRVFRETLNKMDPPKKYLKETNIGLGYKCTFKIKKFGYWLQTQHRDDFEELYAEWLDRKGAVNILKPPKRKRKKVDGAAQYEALFPLG